MKYRKKPVIVDAIKFTNGNIFEIEEFTCGRAKNFCIPTKIHSNSIEKLATCEIETLEGIMIATEGDYIIKGVHGEFYPCKPKIFEKTYEKLE